MINKSEKLGIILTTLFLISYLVWLVYFIYFESSQFNIIRNIIQESSSNLNYLCFLVLFAIGLYQLSMIYHKLIIFLFHPSSGKDKERNKILKEFRIGNISRKEKERQLKVLRIKYLKEELKND